jgi:tetratricopeptide (TPR) repeat protein
MVAYSSLDEERSAQLFAAGDYSALASHATHLDPHFGTTPPRVLERVAIACAMVDRIDDAERIFAVLVDAEPANVGHRLNLGVLYLRSARYADARRLLSECRNRAPDNLLVRFNLGAANFALGDFPAAAADLEEYFKSDSQDEVTRIYLARCRIEANDYDGAEALIEGRRFDTVDSPRERFELSQVHFALGDFDQSEAVLESILRQFPDDIEARIGLAALMERLNRHEEAQRLLESISAEGRGSPQFLLLQGKLEAASGRPEVALQTLSRAREVAEARFSGTPLQRFCSQVEFERGQVLDKLGRHAEAYDAFFQGNQLLRDCDRLQRGDVERGGVAIAGIEDMPAVDEAVRRPRCQPSPSDQPIFLVGFPRSGTTLLDQMLDAHPALQVMEEKPALDAVVAELGRTTRGYPDALLDLQPEDREYLRAIYWQRVRRHLARKPGTQLVDKYPLNLARLQLASCLFPTAKWIFAVRHPCDVVLSCFMQNLRHTEATQGFWSIAQTAEVYSRLMGLWLTQRARLQPDCLDLRYEDLVSDFESGARRLIAFLDLPWDDAVLRYREHAKTRHINTPSYHQVVQPIYRDAAGRWLNYRRWFGEAERTLAPYVTALGYPALDEAG